MNLLPRFAVFASLCALATSLSAATETQRLYLSGHGKDDAVPWKFFCTSGANSGVWTNLPVPSHWDMKGFGTLTYKKDATNAWNERGLYEHDFAVPAEWTGKRVFLVFEGVMTDTTAKLNGESVGPTHQGGFYRFKYEVTKQVKFGATNRLEVDVARHSANESVNKAERLADYWVFAGIYRPVYLEAVPENFIERVAIDAKADGGFAMDVITRNTGNEDTIEAQLKKLDGTPYGTTFRATKSWVRMFDDSKYTSVADSGRGDYESRIALRAKVDGPAQWTAETPNLYQVEVRLKRGGETIHTYKQRFGFRTFEVRDGDGLYLNGKKIILKGVNRHSSWPDSGRCLSEAVHRLDIETIKDMNGNAVRMSHYPPDVEFLDLCDELGLYVLDELAGWHNYYDTPTGTRLVEAMVTRDVNHPSILFWDNGNEGGFNTNLDKIFGQFDPQQRRVLHPWAVHDGVNTAHYLAYDKADVAASGEPMGYNEKKRSEEVNTNLPSRLIYLPTEFMHGLYDGGAGAGLADYWSMMMSHSNCAGGFIWVFADEGVKNPHTGEMDVAGNQAPDGIVGPYREREGSFYAMKQLWSPIQIHQGPSAVFGIENNFVFTDSSKCRFTVRQRSLRKPGDSEGSSEVIREEVLDLKSVGPGEGGSFLMPSWPLAGCALTVKAEDWLGREMRTWQWVWNEEPVLPQDVGLAVKASHFDGEAEIRHGDVIVRLDEKGTLKEVVKGGRKFALGAGPRVVGGTLGKVIWQFREDGWLQCKYTYTATGTNDAIGVLFDYPEQLVKRKRWLGDGPYRVWKNRLGGGTLGVWENDYNNTITGYRGWVYPEFKGFFANVRWLQLETTEGLITVVPENIPFVQVLTPEQPPTNLVANTKVNVPQCGLGFLHAIPPIGTKFKTAESTGPQGQPNIGQGEYSGTVSFYFGKLP
ncbi:MAG: hypothetical protein RLY20_2657 [Verrucomicrobiota bacterium]